eukprot:994982-Pleurochrysis_carterae.AAC.2
MDSYTRVSPSTARRAAAPRPANTAPSICITLPRPAMDALMRARDIAAQHTRAEAEAQRAQVRAAAETDADLARLRSSIAAQHASAKQTHRAHKSKPSRRLTSILRINALF